MAVFGELNAAEEGVCVGVAEEIEELEVGPANGGPGEHRDAALEAAHARGHVGGECGRAFCSQELVGELVTPRIDADHGRSPAL